MATQTEGKRRREIEQGGTESPCPFCGVPRVERSDYIRCCGCGINWLAGEDLKSDPRAQRLAIFLEACRSMPFGKNKNQQGGKP